MNTYYTREKQDEAARKKIEAYREAAALCARIKPVIAAFDGKVYNCRFDKKIAEYGRLFVHRNSYNFSIDLYKDCAQLCVCSVKVDEGIKEKRIQADVLIESCNQRREELLKRAYTIEQELTQVDLYIASFEEIKKDVEHLRKSLSYEVVEIYGLNYSVKKW